jgi:D-beta-D-heptose 7-phosphate kinase/D-beta-D-heptose 1-phosphate adenosyltransferase
VLVVGDVMLDRVIVGSVTRISPEAPVPVVRFESEHLRLGGAANVAHNIAALGGRPVLVGIVGADAAASRLRDELARAGVSADGLVEDRDRPTTEKVRIVTERNQQVARIDYERDADASGDVEFALVERVERFARGVRALLVSDYLKGAITRAVIDALIRAASPATAGVGRGNRRDTTDVGNAIVPPGDGLGMQTHERSADPVSLIVDPKVPHLEWYAGATLVTPNHHEAEVATHLRVRTDDDARQAARDVRTRAASRACGCRSRAPKARFLRLRAKCRT